MYKYFCCCPVKCSVQLFSTYTALDIRSMRMGHTIKQEPSNGFRLRQTVPEWLTRHFFFFFLWFLPFAVLPHDSLMSILVVIASRANRHVKFLCDTLQAPEACQYAIVVQFIIWLVAPALNLLFSQEIVLTTYSLPFMQITANITKIKKVEHVLWNKKSTDLRKQ